MPAPKRRQHGLTLVELTVTLLILTVLATIAIRSTNDLGFQVRYEQTKERLEMIRHAILGNPRLIINGQQAISGFVADMGRLPTCLRELVDNYNCDTGLANPIWANAGEPSNLSVGWRGPYLNISGNPDKDDAFTDGWGNTSDDGNYGWQYVLNEPNLSITSLGKNQKPGGDDYYDADYPNPASQPIVRGNDWLVNISGGISVSFKPSEEESICMKVFFRTGAEIDSESVSINENGAYQTIMFIFDINTEAQCEAKKGVWVDEACHIPVGQNAIGIYKHDGSDCTANVYPVERQPVAVNFYPKAYLPVINW
ncbi:MAG: type II secretion system protein [Methylomicrobium sp.]|nr:type II secretion system protein [Methylomicrobium sp.]